MRRPIQRSVRPPTVAPRGGAGNSGAYAPATPPSGGSGGSDVSSEPMFEFTFETEIKKRQGTYAPETYGQTTITVIAKDHEAAKAKVNVALGEAPANSYSTTYQRIFRFKGVREV